MLKSLLATGVALAALAAAPAMAQSTSMPGSSSTPPASSTQSPSTTQPSTSSSSTLSPTGPAGFVSRQTADQLLASRVMDQSVYGTDGNSIGDVNDLLLDRNGNVVAVVIGVGGFLGIGEKDVAVPFKSVQMTRGSNNQDRLVVSATRADLTNAPAFVPAESTSTTTGSGAKSTTSSGSSGMSGAGSTGTSPSTNQPK